MGQVSASQQRRHGTAAAAFRTKAFRTVWLGSLLSNIGTWMQTVVLPAYIDRRTESGTLVGLFVFAQLGPLLLLSIPAGVLADRLPRKPWIYSMQVASMALTAAMAWFVSANQAVGWLLVVQLLIGVANALTAPAMQGVIPTLVAPADLPGAISLNSTMINGSRVLGPVIAALLMSRGVSLAGVLLVNAASYVTMLVALALVKFPVVESAAHERGWRSLTGGLRIAARRTVLSRCLITMFVFSFVSLAYVGLFPTVARTNLGIDTGASTYKWLYAVWGLGAMMGALSTSTVFARLDKRRLISPLLLAFAVCLSVFALLRSPTPAFAAAFPLGFFYFSFATCVMTVFQTNLQHHERPRVMSLWFMAFGGSVSVGNLTFGPAMDAVGATPVLLLGATTAVVLAWYCNLARRHVVTLADELESTVGHQRGDDALQASGSTGLDEYGIVGGE